MKKILVLAWLPLLLASCILLETAASADSLDDFIRVRMQAARLPGFAACIIKDGQIAWAKGYGFADVENQVRATPNTSFAVASISKSVTATALMQLQEKGLLDLDTDINEYLSFSVRNPRHPFVPITARQLLTHTSAIRTQFPVYAETRKSGDISRPLGVFNEQYFVPGGRYYSLDNFFTQTPGSKWRYSTTAFGLAGHLVEAVSGMPFDLYCKKYIFGPLKMQQTSWFRNELVAKNVAGLYGSTNGGDYRLLQPYKYPDYPGAGLHASAKDLAHFALAHMQNGRFEGARILNEETAREMRRVQYPQIADWQCIGFFNYIDESNALYIGEDGFDLGVTSSVWFRPSDGVGVVMLSNRLAQRKAYDYWNDIFFRLFAEADNL